MALPDGFIAFADLTPQARVLWMSPSAYDLLGYEPEDVIGKPGYIIVSPDQHVDAQKFHVEYAANDLIASQILVRFMTKDGQSILCATVACICYDFSAAVLRVLDDGAEAYMERWAHSTTMNRRSRPKKEEFERMKRHHQATAEHSRNQQQATIEPEARVCLIINRYSLGLTVMYASSACEKVLHVDPDEITGKPILLYIRSDDLAPFVEQVDLIKATTTVSQMRLWFQSPNCRQEIPCEAIVAGTPDGIVAVIRRCRPFVRKHLLGSREQFENRSQGSSVSSKWSLSSGSSPHSEPSSCSSPPVPARGRYGPSTPSPPRNLPWETLNRIRIVDIGDEEPVRHTTLAFQEVVVQDYHEEDDSFEDENVDTMIRGVAISRLNDGDVRS
ncbi:hypothetical protein B0O80DRAFT_424510 [Mortierella sp. GBAus27b]|nr:hypothetical protein B0O80DRAFT_424510 [Mortierella sp. GBAus27b]